MREGRWTTVTPSLFQHERRALQHIQNLLPDAEPYRAWSNFTFTATTGHVREVDLFVVARGGLYLIEIKSLTGRLTASGSNWILTNARERVFDNPLHLAEWKAKQLRSLLAATASRLGVRVRIPYIQAAVFLSEPSLRIELPEHQLHRVYGPEPAASGPAGAPAVAAGPEGAGSAGVVLPPIWSALLNEPIRDERHRVSPELSKTLARLMPEAGIAKSRRHLRIGSWELEFPPYESGPTWQDHHARHTQFPAERRRIRIYLVERSASQAERESIEAAARREMQVLHGISHEGIVQVDAFEDHEAGPALVFRHRPETMRLDHYMARYGDHLDAGTRLDMIRQLGEALAYAHGRHLHHRALAARSILVLPSSRRLARPADGAGQDQGWLTPRLQISDWQAAARGSGSEAGSTVVSVRAEAASQVVPHLERSAEGYLAPELSAPRPDPVALDVFGLGALAYLILTGSAPASRRGELLARLADEGGLRPSAVVDSVSDLADNLVAQATRPVPAERPGSIREFLELLDVVEEELTSHRAASTSPQPAAGDAAAEPDPLEARPGDVVGGEWQIVKRLGTGSTSRAFLAVNTRTGRQEVLKVALSADRAARLEHEAAVLRRLADSRVIRLARQEPLVIGERSVLVLEHAGERTVARKLRDEGRLTVDELETYSDYLFGAVDYLEGEGVAHRDLKPDNIVIRRRQNRTYQLVLIDFSLAGISVRDIEAGTPRYLDPFLGTGSRMVYDDHAERYALAVTLHEMASGELPLWGDGSTEARFTEGPPTLATEAFDPAIRDGLTAFFLRALHRDASARFSSLKEMRDAWQAVFRAADSTPPVTSRHPALGAQGGAAGPDGGADAQARDAGGAGGEPDGSVPATAATGGEVADGEAARRARDLAAAQATLDTPLEAAGLSPRAVSVAHRLNATTVGELLALGSKQIISLPGTGQKTRQELQARIRQWRPLAAAARAAATVVTPAAEEVPAGTPEAELARVAVDGVVARLLPRQRGTRNATELEATRLLLGLPDAAGELPGLPAWPRQQLVAERLGVSAGRVAQVLSKRRRAWHDDPVVRSVHAELVELLAEGGRVMGFDELVTAVLARRGSAQDAPALRRALAAAAVRAAVEIDMLEGEPRLLTRRHDERVLVALEATDDDGPHTPSAPALLDYADALGRVADRLAAADVLPAPATVLRELTAVRAAPAGIGADGGADGGTDGPEAAAGGPGGRPLLDEQRLVRLAAAASRTAAATARLEIYPRDLDPVRALRIAQAGLIPPTGPERRQEPAMLTVAAVHERVRARFPQLTTELPGHPELDGLLAKAGFALEWDDLRGGYVPQRGLLSSTGVDSEPTTIGRQATVVSRQRPVARTPDQVAAAAAESALVDAAAGDGFRALTVSRSRYLAARAELVRRFDAEPVSVATLFLDSLHALVDPRPKPTWETVLAADVAEPGSRSARKIREFVAAAWSAAAPGLLATVAGVAAEGAAGGAGRRPVLLCDAGPFGRYHGMDLLYALADRARAGGRPTWVLCPVEDPMLPPRLDGVQVQPASESEWIPLPNAWVANAHRSGGLAS